MFISDKGSVAKGFKKWSPAHPMASNDDGEPGGTTPLRQSGQFTKQTEAATEVKVSSHGH